jgi:two-component system response regulator RegX3
MEGSVLIIEDDPDLAELIRMYLEKEGISAVICSTAESALELLEEERFNLLTLDLNLPKMDGFEFLQTFRKENETPVIIVSARQSDEDIIMGLGIGADEFVTKPFSPRVLAARVRAILRRSRMNGDAKHHLSFETYTIDIDGFILWREGERVPLSIKEFEVLSFLLEHAGTPFTPDVLYEKVWGNTYGDVTTIAVYIQRLRKKLEPDPRNPRYLQTIHGKGYRFNPEVLT